MQDSKNSYQYYLEINSKNVHEKWIEASVRLHIEHLSYRSFITHFGFDFLYKLYLDWIIDKNAILIVSIRENQLAGFVLGIIDREKIFKPLFRNPLKFSVDVIKGVIVKPTVLPKIVETLLYKSKSPNVSKAELMVIVTDQNERSKGLGSKLIKKLEKSFSKRMITDYVVTVHSAMERSNNFYKKNNMTLHDTFNLYSVEWNLYHKVISKNEE